MHRVVHISLLVNNRLRHAVLTDDAVYQASSISSSLGLEHCCVCRGIVTISLRCQNCHWCRQIVNYHARSGVCNTFGPVCRLYVCLGIGSSYLHVRCISTVFGLSSYMKVIGSRSRSQVPVQRNVNPRSAKTSDGKNRFDSPGRIGSNRFDQRIEHGYFRFGCYRIIYYTAGEQQHLPIQSG